VEGEWQDITPEPATLEVGMTEADLSNKGLKAGGAIIVAAWISHKDKRAMTRLDISSCSLNAEGGKALAAGLKGNQVMMELNIAGNELGIKANPRAMDSSGVTAIANAITDMGAMSKLMFGDKQVVTMTTEMTEANFSGKLESHEAQIVAAFLPKCT
jgi:hypothetical protein